MGDLCEQNSKGHNNSLINGISRQDWAGCWKKKVHENKRESGRTDIFVCSGKTRRGA